MFGDERITREIMGQVPRWLGAVFYVAAAAACGWAAFAIWQRVRSGRVSSATEPRRARVGGRARAVALLRYLLLHEQLRRDPFSGWAHLLMLYGFAILFIGTCLVFLEHDTPLHFFYGWFYQWASLVIDLGGVAFLIGVLMFAARRLRQGSRRILRAWWVTSLSVILLLIGVSGFLLEGARIAVDLPPHERFSVVGYAIALGLRSAGVSGSTAVLLQQWLWGGHAAICVALFALLPWGFFSHMLYGAATASARSAEPLGKLPVWPLDSPPGAATWRDFSTVDLLQSDACTTCGRCNAVCPAASAGKPLQPRDVVLALRGARSQTGATLQPLDVADDVLWSCTTCAACNGACPVGIDVYDRIVDLRRGRVEQGRVPEAAADVFERTIDAGNPYGRRESDRMLWAHGLEVRLAAPGEAIDTLYWVGCAGSFSPEGQAVARSMVKVLNHLGVDYRVLGPAERCTGDPARRMGEEGLFRNCAARNLQVLREHRVRRVITHCPHCFNTMLNEYPQVEREPPAWTVQHHSQFLAEQIAAGRLSAGDSKSANVTFHDPCYLGRGNGIVDAPRQVLQQCGLPVIEMPRHGSESFCCGAGGGSMWLDVRGSERIENQRFEEALQTGANTVATACPFCKTMLEAACQSSERPAGQPPPRIRDLAELVVAAEGL